MDDDSSKKSDGISNNISLVISILAMLIAAGTLYWQFLRGPKLRAYQPNVVYVSATSVGIPVAFTNEGTAADVLTSGSLDLTPRPPGLNQAIPLFWVSPFERKLTYDAAAPNQQRWTEEKADYVLFSHLPIKAGDTDAEIFWFDHRVAIGLQPGCYHACGRFTTARGISVPAATTLMRKDCTFAVDFELTGSDLTFLAPRSNAGPLLDEVTVPVKQCP